jgi:HTH-type transcriptional regulator / antitoxin HigA
MENTTIAKAFPPGDFIKEELDARGWTQHALAQILGRQTSVVSSVVNGKRAISLDIANELAAAFGTSPDYWMNLEKAYQLFAKGRVEDSIARRAKLFAKAPLKEMIRRNWIVPSEDWGIVEQRLLRFLEIGSLDEYPTLIPHAARKSTPYDTETSAQTAWLYRVRELAKGIQATKFSDRPFAQALERLRTLLENPEDVRHVPRVLAEGGVRFLVVESIGHSKIDGACLWLNDVSPVIAMSIRYDRLDNFWYGLAHESGHVKNRDGLNHDPILDINLVGNDPVPFDQKSEMEQRADLFAQQVLIDQRQIEDWMNRTRPFYSKSKIQGFAKRMRVHPAIVLGQLQHRGEIPYTHSREMLVKFRDTITTSALTDGFGQNLPASA